MFCSGGCFVFSVFSRLWFIHEQFNAEFCLPAVEHFVATSYKPPVIEHFVAMDLPPRGLGFKEYGLIYISDFIQSEKGVDPYFKFIEYGFLSMGSSIQNCVN